MIDEQACYQYCIPSNQIHEISSICAPSRWSVLLSFSSVSHHQMIILWLLPDLCWRKPKYSELRHWRRCGLVKQLGQENFLTMLRWSEVGDLISRRQVDRYSKDADEEANWTCHTIRPCDVYRVSTIFQTLHFETQPPSMKPAGTHREKGA